MFNAAAKCKGYSWSDALLSRRDSMNSLIGVSLHFRSHQFAIAGDNEKIFLQFRVTPTSADSRRFLFKENAFSDDVSPISQMLVTYLESKTHHFALVAY